LIRINTFAQQTVCRLQTPLRVENDNLALLRFSGTEPVLRLSVEADPPQEAGELLHRLKDWCRIQNI
jgi:phosphomannomutase